MELLFRSSSFYTGWLFTPHCLWVFNCYNNKQILDNCFWNHYFSRFFFSWMDILSLFVNLSDHTVCVFDILESCHIINIGNISLIIVLKSPVLIFGIWFLENISIIVLNILFFKYLLLSCVHIISGVVFNTFLINVV